MDDARDNKMDDAKGNKWHINNLHVTLFHPGRSWASGTGRIRLFGVLGIVFITLKLCGVIDWSWWWVSAPIWGDFILFCLLSESNSSAESQPFRSKK
jgi:hypothetical protein